MVPAWLVMEGGELRMYIYVVKLKCIGSSGDNDEYEYWHYADIDMAKRKTIELEEALLSLRFRKNKVMEWNINDHVIFPDFSLPAPTLYEAYFQGSIINAELSCTRFSVYEMVQEAGE